LPGKHPFDFFNGCIFVSAYFYATVKWPRPIAAARGRRADHENFFAVVVRPPDEKVEEGSMEADKLQMASDILWEAWRGGAAIDDLPDGLAPRTREDGYAIQALLEGRSREPLFGWKIAATSTAGQSHIGVDGPLAGRLLAQRVHPDGATIPLGANRMRVAEPEFAFRFGRDLSPRAAPYSVAEVLDAAAALHTAIELPDSRFQDFTTVGAAQLIADNACGHEFVLGAATDAPWREIDLARHRVVGRVAGQPPREGGGANVLGDPRVALAWLVNELSGLGLSVAAGQVVTTGTCMTPLAIAAGDAIAADFGALGSVRVRIGA
jgi:2-keto-4-pentenoate hydratase